MATKKKVSHKYLIINLSAFLNSHPLQILTFSGNKTLQEKLNKLLHNSYAVHESHPNITMITMIAVQSGAYWKELSGDKELVRPLI
jgi:hypothetical protein